jgi:hypothetical protein
MKNYIKNIIKKLFFKYCFKETQMAQYIITYYIPNTLKKLDGTKIDGQFLFGQINQKTGMIDPWIDAPVVGIDIGNDYTIHSKYKSI